MKINSEIMIICLFMAHFARAEEKLFETVTDESYLKLEFLPLCSTEGQVIFQITNTSGQLLLIDPAFADPISYDAHSAGVSLSHVTESTDYFDPKIRGKAKLKSQYDWYPLGVGEIIQHKIDFRDYTTDTIDQTLQYMPTFNGMPIRMITSLESKKVTMFKSVIDVTLNDQFGPDCWK
ncbi:hypothetical protein [Shewanella halotolerans]|uniref:hypothetical protein n=1 Tax=Shewanella halotolerans TaxID=2864204 RepID=UPI001C6590E6|nr:hypothetical protein [Shewanella halotolerans]QYJ90483.1 hypothetical protein K0H81_02450 [Shewanella halotolerans]